MAHRHSVYDTDLHFTIDPISRRISSTSGKVTLMQNDHNSERFTFEINRYVEGHDMTLCNVVEVHYINIDAANKRNRSEDVYPVTDLQLCPDDDNVATLSWLISEHATKYAGTLNFIIRFACLSEDEERLVEYQWWTDIYKLIAIGEGMVNTDIVTNGDDSDVLAQWKDEVMALAQPYVDAAANSAVNASESESKAKTSELNAATSEVNAKNSELKAARSEENAKTSETRANAYASNAKASEVNAAKSEANAKASKEYAAVAVTQINNLNDEVLETLQTVSDSVDEYTARLGNTTFTVNLETGDLEYESPDYIFYVNEETGNLEWETLREGSRSGEEMIRQLDSEKTDAIVLTAAGTEINLVDSSDSPVRGLRLIGRTVQNGTPTPDTPIPFTVAGESGNVDTLIYDGDLHSGNLFDNEWVQGTIDNLDGKDYPADNQISTKNFIRIIPNKEYNLRRSLTGGFNKLRFYAKNYQFIGQGSEEMLEVIKGGSASNILRSEAIHAVMRVINEDVAYMRIVETTNDLNMRYFVGVYDGTVNDPYLESQSLTALTPNGLPGIKVTDASLATFTDFDGQMWCCDEIDFERGMYVKRIHRQTFVEDDVIAWQRNVDDVWTARLATNAAPVGIDYVGGVMCDKLPATSYRDHYYGNHDCIAIGSNGYVLVSFKDYTDLSAVEARFVELGSLDVAYVLATPTEHTLSSEELATYKSLHTNYPTTTVISDSDVYMELKYNADTKNYIAAEHVKMENMINAKIAEVMDLISART